MAHSVFLPIEIACLALLAWIVLAFLGLACIRQPRIILNVIFPAGAAISLVIAVVGFMALTLQAQTIILPLGLPNLPFHLRLDNLSGVFLTLLGGVSFAVSIFSCGYFRNYNGPKLALVALQYHTFLASMALVLLADDAYLFMVAWGAMAVASYFLVTTEHQVPQNRSAGFIYLLTAHLGAIAILFSFGVIQGGHGEYTFDALRQAPLTPLWSTVAFLLAFFGFGAKAGMLPLHIWLPEAHPAAPSPVSALMSGVMIKTAIYGMIRVIYDLLGVIQWQWGMVVLTVGAATALFGILFALTQNDLKRLLAYSSVENIGIILIGLGLSMVFMGMGHPTLGVLGLIAALYHTINHGIYKALLFLGAGAILRSSGMRNLNQMGGFIRHMPKIALFMLVGVLSISALPPLNGFASEWLIFQTTLQAPALQSGVLRSLVPVTAAILALVGALTATCFVKVFGIAFLGQMRNPDLKEIHDARFTETIGMAWLAISCVVLGLLPVFVIHLLNNVSLSITGFGLPSDAVDSNWIWLIPTSAARASYSPIIFFAVVISAVLITIFLVHRLYHGRLRRGPAWDCGYPEQTPRMQDSSDAFAQAIRRIFGPVFKATRHFPSPDDTAPRFSVTVEDKHWAGLYLRIARLTTFVSNQLGVVQQGRIHVYLLYSLVTLIALLIFVQ